MTFLSGKKNNRFEYNTYISVYKNIKHVWTVYNKIWCLYSFYVGKKLKTKKNYITLVIYYTYCIVLVIYSSDEEIKLNKKIYELCYIGKTINKLDNDIHCYY